MKRIIKKRGFFARDFHSDALGQKWVKIIFSKRSRLAQLLKARFTKTIKVPKGMRVISVENNKPKVGSVTITFGKIKKTKRF